MRGARVAVGWKGLDSILLAEAGVELLADGTVAVPYKDASGGCWNRKLFAGGRSWWESSGTGLQAPFGLEQVADPDDRPGRQLWIAEGESDCLALRGEYAIWRGLPVDVIGLPGAGTWRAIWAQHLKGYAAAYVFPDGDAAGDRMADAVTRSVPWTVRVRLPDGGDVRGLLQGAGAAELDALITNAEMSAVLLAGMRKCRTIADLERWLGEVSW